MQPRGWWTNPASRWVWLLVGVCAACAAPPATQTPPPTLTLIAATPVSTATPVTPTATPQALPGPSDLVTPRPTDGSFIDSTPSDNLLDVDPIAADLAALAQRRVAQELGLATLRVRVMDVAIYEWTDTSLGCPLPGQTYQPVNVIGYRIVVSAGGNDYIFHSDTEQLIACAADNEDLPE